MNSIGDYQFLVLKGRPVLPSLKLEAQVRPGVDGVGLWEIGVKGEPFWLESLDDAEDLDQAETMAYEYFQAMRDNGVSLIIDNWLFGYLFQVLAVEILEVGPVVASSGGRHAPSTALVRARWQLIALEAN